jgi:pescadillo protein
MKKVKKAVGRDNLSEARRLYSHKPEYSLDHLVKERYPRFGDAVADMDDALCMVHLFASLPSGGDIQADHARACERLVREWQGYVVKTRALRKVEAWRSSARSLARGCGLCVCWGGGRFLSAA